MNAIDTNVLIYSIDTADPRKRQAALGLIESLPFEGTVIPWQVACEIDAVLSKMARAGRYKGDHAEAVRALRACFPIAIPSTTSLERSLELQRKHGVSTWDALLLAACAEAGVSVLHSEDIQCAPEICGVRIVNPFA